MPKMSSSRPSGIERPPYIRVVEGGDSDGSLYQVHCTFRKKEDVNSITITTHNLSPHITISIGYEKAGRGALVPIMLIIRRAEEVVRGMEIANAFREGRALSALELLKRAWEISGAHIRSEIEVYRMAMQELERLRLCLLYADWRPIILAQSLWERRGALTEGASADRLPPAPVHSDLPPRPSHPGLPRTASSPEFPHAPSRESGSAPPLASPPPVPDQPRGILDGWWRSASRRRRRPWPR